MSKLYKDAINPSLHSSEKAGIFITEKIDLNKKQQTKSVLSSPFKGIRAEESIKMMQ
jgi:hypothetical protein